MSSTVRQDELRARCQRCSWRSANEFSLSGPLAGWLTETGSMTARFEHRCASVSVEPLFEGFVEAPPLADEAHQLPNSDRYWLREIVLFGDGVPWLWGRTLIPELTLTDEERRLMTLNKTPLGHYLFSSGRLSRDYLQITQCDGLWGRHSRLRLADKPLLLTEFFLPSAPLY